MAGEEGELVNTDQLLFLVRDTFHARIDGPSLVQAMREQKFIKKKKGTFPDGKDDRTVAGYIYGRFFQYPIASKRFIDVLRVTGREKNVALANYLQDLVDQSKKPVLKYGGSSTAATSGSTFIHTDPDEPASAVFTSEGGILYSPYHGVTVYIPKGAIPEGQNVRASFWPVVDKEELRILLSHPLFRGAFLCSHVFNFEAKLTKGEVEEVFDAFSLDVWIEVPYYMVFGDITNSLQSPLFVLSQRDDQVQCENNVVFAPGYPYANICIRHFSKYSIAARRPLHFTPNLSMRHQLSMYTHSERSERDAKRSSQLKVRGKMKMLSEMATTSNEACRLSLEMEIVSKHVSGDQRTIRGSTEEEEMEVDIGSCLSFPVSYASSHRRGLPLYLSFFAFQPKDRHKMQCWNDDLFILPHLPESNMIMDRHLTEGSYDCSGERSFVIANCEDWVYIDGDFYLQPDWQVELSGNKIPLYTFGTVDQLSTSMLVSSHVLPKCQVKVTHMGSRGDLRYHVTVRCSEPLTSYELTSGELDTRRTKEELAPRPLSKTTSSVMLDWRVDRPLFVLLSLILRENITANISEAVGLSPADLDLITSTTPKALNVGEQLYKVFTEALTRESPSLRKFSQLLCIFTNPELDLDQSITDFTILVINSYMRYKQLESITVEEPENPQLYHRHSLSCFLTWAESTLHTSTLSSDQECLQIEDSHRCEVFCSLSKRILHVWKMVGRLLLLEDSDINAIEVQCTSMKTVPPSEISYKMLYSWSEQTENQSDVTYNHLYTVLQIISRCYAARVVADALFCLQNSCIDHQCTTSNDPARPCPSTPKQST